MNNKQFASAINLESKEKTKNTIKFDDNIQIKEIEQHILDELYNDSTDILDNDEQEILNDENTESPEFNQKIEYNELIIYIETQFLNKYPHLDNFKNKKIIYQMCYIAVTTMPEHINEPIFYLNFIESSIKLLIEPKLEDIL